MNRRCIIGVALVSLAATQAVPPQAVVSNSRVHAQLYLPDAQAGYYQGTRFDWSGVIWTRVMVTNPMPGSWTSRVRSIASSLLT